MDGPEDNGQPTASSDFGSQVRCNPSIFTYDRNLLFILYQWLIRLYYLRYLEFGHSSANYWPPVLGGLDFILFKCFCLIYRYFMWRSGIERRLLHHPACHPDGFRLCPPWESVRMARLLTASLLPARFGRWIERVEGGSHEAFISRLSTFWFNRPAMDLEWRVIDNQGREMCFSFGLDLGKLFPNTSPRELDEMLEHSMQLYTSSPSSGPGSGQAMRNAIINNPFTGSLMPNPEGEARQTSPSHSQREGSSRSPDSVGEHFTGDESMEPETPSRDTLEPDAASPPTDEPECVREPQRVREPEQRRSPVSFEFHTVEPEDSRTPFLWEEEVPRQRGIKNRMSFSSILKGLWGQGLSIIQGIKHRLTRVAAMLKQLMGDAPLPR